MKRLLILIINLIIVLSYSFGQDTKNTFEGTITYQITPMGPVDLVTKLALDNPVVAKYKGNKSCTVINFVSVLQTNIIDGDNKTSIDVLDINGVKYAITKSQKQIDDELDQTYAPKIEFVDSTKVICGITCKKAIVTKKDDYSNDLIANVYYAPEFGGKDINFFSDFRGINGLLLEYEIYTEFGLNMRFTAVSMKKGKVSDKIFEIPKEAWELSLDELRRILSGGQ